MSASAQEKIIYDFWNAALGAPVTVSPATPVVSGQASYITDGNLSTVLYSNQGGPVNHVTFVVDLGTRQNIGRIDVSLAWVQGFSLLGSDDNRSFTPLPGGSWSWSAPMDGPVSAYVNGSYARYIKFDGWANTTAPVGVYELEVYNYLNPPVDPPVSYEPGKVNIALNRPVMNYAGTANPTYPASNVNDGNKNTFWLSNAVLAVKDSLYTTWGQIMIDLGSNYTIGKFIIDPKNNHWYRVFVTKTPTFDGSAPQVFKSYPDLFGTSTTATEQGNFGIYGLAEGRYVWIWTQTNSTPAPIQPGAAEVAVLEYVRVQSPWIGVTETSFYFENVEGQPYPHDQTLKVWNMGGGTLYWTAASNASWLTVSPTSGTSNWEIWPITVRVNPAGLARGTHNAAITITGKDANNNPAPNSPTVIPVTLKIGIPIISFSLPSISFNVTAGSGDSQQRLTVNNTGVGTLNWTATSDQPSWLTISPSSGSIPSGGSQDTIVTTKVSALAPGTYTGNLTFSAPGATSVVIPVTVVVQAPPMISLNPASLTFSGILGASIPPQTTTISNSGGGTMNWTAGSSNTQWLTVSPASGSLTGGASIPLNVSVNASYLGVGTYAGAITITAPGASGSPATLPVTISITRPPAVSVTPTSLSFAGTAGSVLPGQALTVSNTGGGNFTWTASASAPWVTVNPASGTVSTTPTTLTVSVDTSALAPGTSNASITIAAAGAQGSPVTVPVTVKIGAGPAISVSTNSLLFSALLGGANPANQTFAISNSGGGMLDWTASDNASWLDLSPTSGSLTGSESSTVTASVNIAGLSAGTYNANITISASEAINSPFSIPVTLTVLGPKLSYSPQTLSFSGTTTLNPPTQTLTLTNSGGGTLAWSITPGHTWLTASPASGSLTAGQSAPVTINITTVGLAPMTHLSTLTIIADGADGSPATIPVIVGTTVGAALSLGQNTLAFEATAGDTNPANQTVTISNSGGSTLNWTASGNAQWLTVSPTSGIVTTGAQIIAVSVNTTGLNAGTYSANITITAPGAAGSPAVIAVTLTLAPKPGPSGAQALKTDSITTLERLVGTRYPRIESGDKKYRPYWEKEVQDAIKHIRASLVPGLWVDDSHLNARTGDKVFQFEREAANDLKHLLDKKDVPAEVRNTARAVSESLVQADRMLANIAFNEAKQVATTPKALRYINQAKADLMRADGYAGSPTNKNKDYVQAIEFYGKAWQAAMRAIGAQYEPTPPPPAEPARPLKQDAVNDLKASMTGQARIDNSLKQAIRNIEKSLNAAYWIDDIHLDARDGDKVFEYEKLAANDLKSLARGGNLPPEIKDLASRVQGRLLEADRRLAATAIREAKEQGGRPEYLSKADEAYAKAQYELIQKAPDITQAFEQYKKAWEYAVKAVQSGPYNQRPGRDNDDDKGRSPPPGSKPESGNDGGKGRK